MRFFWAALVLLATPGLAQQTQAPPCMRSSTTVKLAGLDLDTMRCQLSVEIEMIANSAVQLSEDEAKLRLMTQDLDAVHKAADTLTSQLDAANKELEQLRKEKPVEPSK